MKRRMFVGLSSLVSLILFVGTSSTALAAVTPNTLGSNCGPYITNTFSAGGQNFGWGSKACVDVPHAGYVEGDGFANFASSQPQDYIACDMYVEFKSSTGTIGNNHNGCTATAQVLGTFQGFSALDYVCNSGVTWAAAETIAVTVSVNGIHYQYEGSRVISHTYACP